MRHITFGFEGLCSIRLSDVSWEIVEVILLLTMYYCRLVCVKATSIYSKYNSTVINKMKRQRDFLQPDGKIYLYIWFINGV